jgi:hypothetical protein
MPIVVEFIENTNFEIQLWIMNITYKLYTHKKTRKHKLLKSLKKIKQAQNAKTQTTNKTLNLNVD